MTNEEIIQGLQFTIDMFLFDPSTGEVLEKPRNDMDKTTIEACKGAIELLEQQPCYNPDEWCHDCSEYNHEKHCCPRYNKVIRGAVEEMKQPKVGHWRHYEGMLICSECGSVFYDDIMEYCGDDVPKCCPDCGARMVEPQESEE